MMLWPDASELAIGWRGPVQGGLRFAVIPTVRDPRFLVPRASAAAVALRPASQGRRGMKMRALSLLQRTSLLHRLPGPRLHVGRGPHGSGVEDLLRQVVGDVAHVVVRLGRPRPNRTLVVWALDDHGAAVGIAKLSTGEEARAALEREFAVLADRPTAGIAGLRAPEALGYVRWAGSDVLVISALVGVQAHPSHDAPVAQMLALARSAPSADVPVRDAPMIARLREEVAALRGDEDRAWLEQALTGLVAELGDVEVTTGAWHGDWVSWNMSLDDETVLLWDWEHYAPDALAGFDHVHFIAQELRAEGTDAATEDRWLSLVDHALAEHWGLGAAARAVVLRAYLVEVNLRFVRDRQDETVAAARAGWARPLLDRLARVGAAQP